MKKESLEKIFKRLFKKEEKIEDEKSREDDLWARNLFSDLGRLGGKIILMSK